MKLVSIIVVALLVLSYNISWNNGVFFSNGESVALIWRYVQCCYQSYYLLHADLRAEK